MSLRQRTAVIIGAGPAGLTAAYELLARTDIKPVILEATGDLGGISKTVNYKGNRIDVGGHRFFSKSDRIMRRWYDILPLQGKPAKDDIDCGRQVPLSLEPNAPDPETTDKVLLTRERVSRIFFLKKFFDYPLSLRFHTLAGLGLLRTGKITASYLRSWAAPIKPEHSLEDFFINRFGRELYATFFRDYTQKVWGVPCSQIPPEWGEQRVKGLSIKRAIADAAKAILARDNSVAQKETETSLIRRFFYPKFGPGQMWTETARLVQEKGGEIRLRHKVIGLKAEGRKVTAVVARDETTGATIEMPPDYVISSMPVRDLIAGFDPTPPADVREVAAGLVYRDFITVGLLLRRLRTPGRANGRTANGLIPDCWIYIQEPYVKVGRVQIFNNWSPYLVADPSTVWIGLEYFCTEGDDLWCTPDAGLMELARREMSEMGFIEPRDVLDGTVLRTLKTYPAYFGSYSRFETVRHFTDPIDNLFLIGRNGMHKYNNADHSMLTAMAAVDSITNGIASKANIWAVNTEGEYHEQRTTAVDNLIDAYRNAE
ncbi:MAG: NAD(P)/FAD-dependent oxidoreductase [Planctomycetes bacterium]|nr:NAD(P)/FAD-dependent oxidoreductase [Planctomycetota bacterium]